MRISNTKSVIISIGMCSAVIMAVLLMMIVMILPNNFLLGFVIDVVTNMTAMYVSSYILAAFVIAIMALLIRVLLNIKKGDVFVMTNVTALRIISWLCLICAADACVLFLAGLTLSPVIVAFVAVVCSMLIRVVKNAFYEATVIKNENDLTV